VLEDEHSALRARIGRCAASVFEVMNLRAVAEGYAELMSRFALPLFLTQTFGTRSHPEAVVKAHRHFLNLANCELHGTNWKRRGVVGAQSILGVERHKTGFPHSHAVIGHPDVDLGSAELSALRRTLRLTCEDEWGFAKLEVATSPAEVNAYVAKYVVKDGELTLSSRLEALNSGQLALLGRPASTGEGHAAWRPAGGRAHPRPSTPAARMFPS
jgi:hypothetical protein